MTADTIAVGELRAVAVEGDPAHMGEGATYARIGAGAVGGAGEVAFSATLARSAVRSAVLQAGRGATEVLLRAGDEAPCGGRYRSFGEVALGADGTLLFGATLGERRPAAGVFLRTPAGAHTVAMAGGEAPCGGAYVSFRDLSIVTWAGEDGPRHRLAFVAGLDDGRRSLVMAPSQGRPVAVLTTGERVGDDLVEGFAVSRVGLAMCCVATLRRPEAGAFRLALIVDEGRKYWSDRLRDGGQVPGLGTIARLLAPPAVNVQMGFVAVELAGGGGALCTRPPALAQSEALVRTGDPLPGHPDRPMEALGPPVASCGVPLGGPFGVASAARLRGGRAALWVGVFGGQLPIHGRAIAPVLEGDRTDDRRALPVRRFAPVELTNGGALLLRATAGERRALLVLDRLFDWYSP